MIARVVKSNRRARTRTEDDIPCSGARKIFWDNGVDVILHDVYGRPGEKIEIQLPQDGERVYFMNDQGDTVDTVAWPNKDKKEGAIKKKKKVATEVISPELRVMV